MEIKSENGNLVWSQNIYKFVQDKDAPDSVNPSLWRNTQLNSLYGLFEVTDGVYQVRGYDVANITFVRGSQGWIIFDCTTSVETAKAALEQLGYQAESGAWRNAYLNAAYELRHGTDDYPDTSVGGTGAYTLGMSTETMLDYLGICMDAKAMEKENLVINMEVTDENTKYLLRIHNGVLLYSKESWSDNPDATIRTSRTGILGIALNNQKLMDASIESVSGDEDVLKILTGNLAEFNPYFNIIEP